MPTVLSVSSLIFIFPIILPQIKNAPQIINVKIGKNMRPLCVTLCSVFKFPALAYSWFVVSLSEIIKRTFSNGQIDPDYFLF